MINRTDFNLLLRAGLRKDFRDNYKAWEQEYDMFLHVGTMEGARVEAATMAGLPRQVQLGELEPYTLVDPAMSDKVTYTDTIWGLAFGASKEALKDDEYGKLRQNAKWLGRSVRLTQEYEAADLLNDAFTGTVFTGLFGEPLISATHQMLGGAGTWSNLVAGNPQLGILGLQAAFETMERTVDQNGDPIVMRMDKLIIGVSDEWMAIQLLQNPDEPFTSNRNINTTRRKRQLGYVVSHYMTQTGRRWFAIDSTNHDAHFLWKERPSFPEWYENMIRAWIFASYQRFLVYFYDQRGWIGSNAS